jgi:hypothetical protein
MQLHVLIALLLLSSSQLMAQGKKTIPQHSKLFLAPMNGFENELKQSIEKKKLPLEFVSDRTQADYEVTGVSETDRVRGIAKLVKISTQSASITVTDTKTGEIVLAHSVGSALASKSNGKKSYAGDDCAKYFSKHLQVISSTPSNNH